MNGRINQQSPGDTPLKTTVEKELSELYFNNYDVLINYGLKLTSDKTVVEDAIQEIFVDLLHNWKKYLTIRSPKFYLFKSIKYIVLKEVNKKSMNLSKPQFFSSLNFSLTPVENDIIEEEESIQKKKILYDSLNNLSPKEKESIYLKYINGLDYPEIAEILEIKIETARTLVYRALKKIKKINPKQSLYGKIQLLFMI